MTIMTIGGREGARDQHAMTAPDLGKKIRSFSLIFALNLEEGGEMLQPMAAGAIGGLTLGILVALFMMPCLYVIFSGKKQQSSLITVPETDHRSV